MQIFGERLKWLREKYNKTQEDLAKLIGKSRETVSKYEIGEREPHISELTSLAKHFNVSADYMLGLSHELNRESSYSIIHEADGASIGYLYPEFREFEEHLKDTAFARYVRLAVKIRDNGVDVRTVENIVDELITYKNKLTAKDKEKHP